MIIRSKFHIQPGEENEECNLTKIEEFDQEFITNNPGVSHTQKYIRANWDDINDNEIMISNNNFMRQNSSLLNEERKVSPSSDNNSLGNSTFYIHINLANNKSNHTTKFGLNQNKRGKMTEND